MTCHKNTIFIPLITVLSINSLPNRQNFSTVLDALQKNQVKIAVLGAAAAAAAYIGYALYLDTAVNKKDSLWYWALHHMDNGVIDQVALLEYIQKHYPDAQELHPLAAMFATASAIQAEIDTCLSLRSSLKALKNIYLDWILSETTARLDKKIECLYLLKLALWQCTTETRTRCKKLAQLI